MIEAVNNIVTNEDVNTAGLCWLCDVPDNDCSICIDGKFDIFPSN